MITPTLVQQCGFPVLPLGDLVDYPLILVGLGRKHTSLLSFVILRVQVREIAGYDEDVVFLVVPDESEFGQMVPLVIGTCTIGRIISVIQESEIDRLSMPWATSRMVQLLFCQKSTTVLTSGSAETQVEGASGGPQEGDMDELVTMRECPFRTVPDQDHRGMCQAPPRRHISRDDHSTEGGRSTTGRQATSSEAPCPLCVHAPQEQ